MDCSHAQTRYLFAAKEKNPVEISNCKLQSSDDMLDWFPQLIAPAVLLRTFQQMISPQQNSQCSKFAKYAICAKNDA